MDGFKPTPLKVTTLLLKLLRAHILKSQIGISTLVFQELLVRSLELGSYSLQGVVYRFGGQSKLLRHLFIGAAAEV